MRSGENRQRLMIVILGGLMLFHSPAEAQRSHTVEPGDTLWAIARTNLGDPLRWSEIWKSNPFVTNPDRIYPGQVLTLAEPESPGAPRPALEPTEAQEPTEAAAQDEHAAAPPVVSEGAATPQQAPALLRQLGLTPPPVPPMIVKTSGTIIADQPASGTIIASKLRRQLLIGPGDLVFLKPQKGTELNDGAVFMVARKMRKVYHPKTGVRLGHLIQVLGEVIVREHQRGLTIGEVTKTFEPIQAGDMLLPPPAPSASAAPIVPPTEHAASAGEAKSITGYIVESKVESKEHGQFDIVYLDKGRRDGVHVDDIYMIIREGRSAGFLSIFSPAIPDTHLGELRVITVEDATATAEITRSVEPINVGDSIEGPVVSAGLPAP